MPTLFRVKGALDIERLERSFREIVNRHETLRTVIRQQEGKAYQYALPSGGWNLNYRHAMPEGLQESDLRAYIESIITRPFDLEADYLFRADLIGVTTGEYMLVLVTHHIASDGWSLGILLRELTELYESYGEGRPPKLRPCTIQYSDYALWQRRYLSGGVLETQLEYWTDRLTGVLPLELPTDFPRPSEQSSRGGLRIFRISGELRDSLQELSRRQKATLFMTLLSAYKILLSRYSGQEDICVGVPVAGRTQQELEELIGFFINTLPLRSTVRRDASFRSLLDQVKETTLGAYENQDAPFEKVVEKVVKQRDMSRNPLFQVAFTMQNTPEAPPLRLGEAVLSRENTASRTSQFDLNFSLAEDSLGISLAIEYCRDLYEAETIDRMGDQYLTLLDSIVKDVDRKTGQFILLTADTERRLLQEFNDTAVGYPREKTIVDLFAEQAERVPGRPAVGFETETLTYRQLDENSNRLGHYLQQLGVTEDTPVAICLDRGPDMIVGLLGILKAAGAYVPIDPAYPADRIAFILHDTAAPVVLTTRHCRHAVPPSFPGIVLSLDEQEEAIGRCPDTRPLTQLQPHHLAYVIYTSGSTGQPKGVLIEHRQVVRLFKTQKPLYDFNEHDVWTLFHSFCFDFSVWEIFGALLFGGRLLIVPKEISRDVIAFGKLLLAQHVTVLNTTPSAFYVLQEQLTAVPQPLALRYVIFGGEALNLSKVTPWKRTYPGARLINMYGITETTVHVTFQPIEDRHLQNSGSLIGKAIPTTEVYLLDKDRQLLPIGIGGEMYVGGDGLARGYLNQAALTADRFIADPFSGRPGARLYRTGDLGRWLPDGSIEYLGRIDEQVKIRGYRIEPGEIENAARHSGLVRQCVVLARPDVSGHLRLIGYVIPEGVFDRQALLHYLRDRLPEYMVPALWVPLAAIPLTGNGKTDTRALPDPDAATTAPPDKYLAPRNLPEAALAAIWQQLLGLTRVGVLDNFFELGGDSIISIQVVSRARQAGYEIRPKDIFLHQTIDRLAAAVLARAERSALRAEQGFLRGQAGLLPIQQWYLQREGNQPQRSHANQSLLIGIDKRIGAAELSPALLLLAERHDALRFRYERTPAGWRQTYGNHTPELIAADLRHHSPDTLADAITATADRYQRSLDIEKGDLLRAVWIQTPEDQPHHRLLLVIHHLAVDGVSWRILLDDLQSALSARRQEIELPPTPKTSSCRDWYAALREYAASPRLLDQQLYWGKLTAAATPLPVDNDGEEPLRMRDQAALTVALSREQTRLLLQEAPAAYHTEINDLLLAALARVLCRWSGHRQILIGLEGHGREEAVAPGIDLSRTVGWFTSLFPVLLDGLPDAPTADLIKTVKETLRAIPDKGLGYGVLRYLDAPTAPDDDAFAAPAASSDAADAWEAVFNYFGQTDNVVRDSPWFSPCAEAAGQTVGDAHRLIGKLAVNGWVANGQLYLNFDYSQRHYRPDTIRRLADAYLACLTDLVDQCLRQLRQRPVFTPSDYGLAAAITWPELDRFLENQLPAAVNGPDSLDQPAAVNGPDSPHHPPFTALYRLSGLQEGMLFHSLYEEDVKAYIEQFGCQLPGVVPALLIDSWKLLLQRHSVLRTAFYHEDFRIPVQAVFPAVDLPVTILDYRHLEAADRQDAIRAYEEADRNRGFDFTRAPLMRLALLRTGEDNYRMIWTTHHILLDGWSMPILLTELQQLYAALAQGTPPPPAEEDRYEDYIRYIESRDKAEEKTFWRTYLAGAARPVLLPFIGPVPDRNKGIGDYGEEHIRLDRDFTAALNRYAQRRQLTVNTVMQGIWAYLLHRYTGQDEITYGVIVSGRPGELPGVEQRVGMYINTLPLHTRIDPDATVTGWLQELQAGQVACRQHQYSRLADLQKWAGVADDWFDSLLVFENYPVSKTTVSGGLRLRQVRMNEQTNYPLTVTVGGNEELWMVFGYNMRLLDGAQVRRIGGHFHEVLRQLVATQPSRLGDLQPLTGREREALKAFNDTSVDYPRDQTIAGLFAEQARRTPGHPAIVFETETLTYRQLEANSNRLAHYLRQLGVTEDTPVALCLDRGPDMIVAILGILKAGGAYVPIDPAYPPDRIAYLLHDTAAPVLLTGGDNREALPASYSGTPIALDTAWATIGQCPDTPPPTGLRPHHLAYIIYTSGSTGKPKGVMIEHRSVVNLILHQQRRFGIRTDERILQFSAYSFDASVEQIFLALLSGAALVLVSEEIRQDPTPFGHYLREQSVTHLHATPAFLDNLPIGPFPALRRVIAGGELCKPELVGKWKGVDFYNEYGPTEGTVTATEYHCPAEGWDEALLPIGKPLANTRAYIVDGNGAPAPVGVAGELQIGGVQVARGYLNLPELTQAQFLPDPDSAEPGARLYRTGDLARWLPCGDIEYLGRMDRQVKIRGYRIEPGEIESIARQSGLVKACVVLARPDVSGHQRLTGYVIPEETFDQQELIARLRRRLPEYMVPALWVPLASMPLTANGKIDTAALPDPDAAVVLPDRYAPPRNEVETALADIWQQLLGVKRVGIHDNFFELGGDSLLAMRLISSIGHHFKSKTAIKTIFKFPRLWELAEYIQVIRANDRADPDREGYDVHEL